MAFDRSAPNPTEISVGTHLLEIKDVREGLSKSSGNPQWTVTAVSTEDRSKELKFWLPLAGKMRWKTSLCLDVLGFPKDAKVEAYSLIGKRFYAAIKHEEFRGEMQARIDERADDSQGGMWPEEKPPVEIQNELAQASNLFDDVQPPKPIDPEAAPF